MSKEQRNGFVVNDRRGEKEPKPTCRVCGSQNEHSKNYNQPTMACIKYLRNIIKALEKELDREC